jgi:hypothetical protein
MELCVYCKIESTDNNHTAAESIILKEVLYCIGARRQEWWVGNSIRRDVERIEVGIKRQSNVFLSS